MEIHVAAEGLCAPVKNVQQILRRLPVQVSPTHAVPIYLRLSAQAPSTHSVSILRKLLTQVPPTHIRFFAGGQSGLEDGARIPIFTHIQRYSNKYTCNILAFKIKCIHPIHILFPIVKRL